MLGLHEHLGHHVLVKGLLDGLHLVGGVCDWGVGHVLVGVAGTCGYSGTMTPRALLLLLGKPGLLVVPRLGESDVHLGVVLLEPDHLHGVVLVLVFHVSCSPGCCASTWTATTPGLRSSSSRRTQCSA